MLDWIVADYGFQMRNRPCTTSDFGYACGQCRAVQVKMEATKSGGTLILKFKTKREKWL
jgi:hypothetical protein